MADKQLWLEQVSLKGTLGGYYLLNDISFDVAQGDRIAIVGPSGAGKTSLLRLLNRLNEVSSGSIYFEGQEIRQIPVIQLRQHITLVPQESKLLGMTVREALTYPLKLRQMPQSTIQQRLSTWMELIHLPSDWLDRTEVQLSVGQRQLVAIARALMIQPKILLLDEPTSALDAGRGSHLLNLLNNLADTSQITILMVNHQLELAEQFCSKVLFLQQGKLLHNAAKEHIDWATLKEQLIQAEAQESDEWT
ncbi:MAG TPA: ATP-binding cassette domain-containing protein [Crinalium sp.]